jgi:hypothetical protein
MNMEDIRKPPPHLFDGVRLLVNTNTCRDGAICSLMLKEMYRRLKAVLTY